MERFYSADIITTAYDLLHEIRKILHNEGARWQPFIHLEGKHTKTFQLSPDTEIFWSATSGLVLRATVNPRIIRELQSREIAFTHLEY